MTTNFERVKEFHEVFDIPISRLPTVDIPLERQTLRVNLIREEAEEFETALANGDLNEVADALADLLYVTYGAGLEFGIDLDRVFIEVQRSNMTKLGEDGKPVRREDGKVLKGPNFELPDIDRILQSQPPIETR